VKYFTKEWYELCQKESYHFALRADKRAETFSEEYFEKLYKKAVAEHIAMMERVNSVKFEDIYPEEFYCEPLGDYVLSQEEIEELKAEYYERREAAKYCFETMDRSVVPSSEKRKFRRNWKCQMEIYNKNLPSEILDMVADIRVLALGNASAEVKKAITAFCRDNEKTVNKTMSDYWKYYKKAFGKNEPHFADGFDLHDCYVTSCHKSGKNIVMHLEGGMTNTTRVVFRDTEVLCREEPLRGAWWLYDELYKTENGYEMHVLLYKKELVYFTLTCTDVEIYSD